MFMGLKRFLTGAVLALSLANPGKVLARTHLAQMQMQAQRHPMDKAAERYVEIVTENLGFESGEKLQITLNVLALESINNPEFKKYCNETFKCKEMKLKLILISSRKRNTEKIIEDPWLRELLDAMDKQEDVVNPRNIIHSLIASGEYCDAALQIPDEKIKTLSETKIFTFIASTTPVYIDKALATKLGVQAGWLMVIKKVTSSALVKGKGNSTQAIEIFEINLLVMHF